MLNLKKTHLFILLLSFILLQYNCNNKTSNNKCKNGVCKKDSYTVKPKLDRPLITLSKVKDIAVKADKGVCEMLYKVQPVESNKLIFAAHFKNAKLKKNKIILFDLLKHKQLKEIDIKGNMESFYYLNKDSVLVLFNPHSNDGYNHDSTLVLVNEKGKIYKSLSYDAANVTSSKNGLVDYNNQNSAKDKSYLRTYYLFYDKNNVFLDFANFGNSRKIIDINDFVGKLNIVNNKFTKFDKIKYPYLKKGIYYPGHFEGFNTQVLHDGKHVLYSFLYTPTIYKYNYDINKLEIFRNFDSYFIDTIKADKKIPKSQYILNRRIYVNINFDKKYNRYFRQALQSIKKNKRTIILADSNFNAIGEGMQPAHCQYVISLSEDTLLFTNYQKTGQSKDSIFFTVYKMEFNKGDINSLKFGLGLNKKLFNLKIEDYIKSVTNIKDTFYSLIIVQTSLGCPSCITEIIKYFGINYKKFSNSHSYLLLTDSNLNNITSRLRDNKLDIKSKNIFYDNSNSYMDYVPKDALLNPRLILVENGKIVKDKIYSAKEMIKLQKDNLEFLKKHGFIKGYEEK